MRSSRAALTLFFFGDGLLIGSWASRIPAVQAQAGLTNTRLGFALFAASLGALLVMPFAGRLCERLGSRRVTVAALVVAAASLFAAANATGFATLALSLLGFGAGFGSINVAANAQGIALERIYGRGIFSSFHAAFSVGAMSGAALGALAARLDVTPRLHLGALALLVAATALFLGRMLLAPAAGAEAPQRLLVRPPRALLALGAAAFCTLLAEGSAADWSATYLDHSVRTTAAVAGLGYALFAFAMAASRMFGDGINNRLGPVALVRGGGALAACGLTAALLANSVPVALVGFAAMGAGVGVQVPVLFRAGGSTPGMSPSVGVAAVSTIGWLGFLAGPPAIGLLAGVGGLRGALTVVVAALVGLVLLAPSAATGGSDAPGAGTAREAPAGTLVP